jgi:hypothetical protein
VWATVIICLAQIAAGYVESQNSHDDHSAFYLAKLMEINNSIREMNKNFEQVKAAIVQAVKMIQREVHESAMLDHYADMDTSAMLILGVFQELGTYEPGHDPNDPKFAAVIERLTKHRDDLYRAVNSFAKQDGGAIGKPATLQTFVCCSASIALWAKAYQKIEDYKPEGQRIPAYKYATSASYRATFLGFLDDVAVIVQADRDQLNGPLLAPDVDRGDGILLRYQDHRFNMTDIPYAGEYPAELKFDRLFFWKFLHSHNSPAGLYGTELDGVKYVWRYTSSDDEAYKACMRLREARKDFRERYEIYAPIDASRIKVLKNFDGPVDSSLL